MDKFEFMSIIKDILEDVKDEDIEKRANEMKRIIDQMAKQELNFAKAGLR